LSSDATLINEAPSPRDRVLGGLLALRLVDDPKAATDLVRSLQGWIYEAHSGDSLYGLPSELTDLAHLDRVLASADPRTLEALSEIRELLAMPTPVAVEPAESGQLVIRDRQRARELICSCRPKKRDDGWRLVRIDVPVLLDRPPLSEHGDGRLALLLGMQVEPIEPAPGGRGGDIQVQPGQMDDDFLAGVRDGRDAALELLQSLGADEEVIGWLRHLFVRFLGLASAQPGSELLTGRSAGLPVALGLLQRASELMGNPLPDPGCVATGSFRSGGLGGLDGISRSGVLAKLEAVLIDGRRKQLLCPSVTDDDSHIPLEPGDLPDGVIVVAGLREAAEQAWGDSWRKLCDRLAEVPVLDNLPGPTYRVYFDQPQVEGEVNAALASTYRVIALEGPSGVGKSTIARELAERLIDDFGHGFEAIIWISDRPQPGSTTLQGILRKVARVLNYNRGSSDEGDMGVELRRHPFLLILDNFETIVDPTVAEWLTVLPRGSKALVTVRPGGIPADLREYTRTIRVTKLESPEDFARDCLARLRLEDLPEETLDDVLALTAGNPKVIELALGYVKSDPEGETGSVEDRLRASGELFTELVQGNFELLDPSARWLLLSTEFYPYGATPGDLAAVAGLSEGEAEASAVRLGESGLLDLERGRGGGDYSLLFPHPIGREFIAARLRECPAFAEEARERWLARQVDLARSVGYCPDEINRLRLLDRPGAKETLVYATNVAHEVGKYRMAVAIAREARYYFYVRGFWVSDDSTNLLWAKSARELGDACEEFDALTYHANIRSKQGDVDAVEKVLPRLRELEASGDIPPSSRRKARHAEALYLLAKKRYSEAEAIWVAHLKELDPAHESYSPAARWLAICVQRDGRPEESRRLAQRALDHARQFNLERAVVATMLHLTELDIRQDAVDAVEARLRELAPLVAQVNDLSYAADFAYFKGVASARRGKTKIAEPHLLDAIERYKRLGRRDREELVVRVLGEIKGDAPCET
jgi:tetratricopeptide (TPR) repeat protein